jgi:peptidoglycan hydrolase-like protein with peptidoglycan-binding domain
MKTIITESELINRARGLREYLNVLEATFNPNVKALQDKLIQAGATIKADGFMGPATQAAMKQFPTVTTQTAAEKAVGADINSANTAPAAPAAQVMDPNQADKDDAELGAAMTANAAAAAAAPAAQAPAPVAAPAAWAPTPEQTKWLGAANPQDPYIMSRMPGAKPPVTYFKNPQDQAKAKQLGFPAAPAAPGQDIDIGFGPGKYQPEAKPATATPVKPPAPVTSTPIAPITATKESVGYGDEQILARIVELSRR